MVVYFVCCAMCVLFVDCWMLLAVVFVVGCDVLFAGDVCLLFVACCRLCCVCCLFYVGGLLFVGVSVACFQRLLFVVCWFLLAVCGCALFVVCCLLCVVCRLWLFVVRCLLFAVCCSLLCVVLFVRCR